MQRNANVQSARPSAPTHAVDSRNGYARSTRAGHARVFEEDMFGSPPHGYARSAATAGPTLDPRPQATPNVENALALFVLSEMRAMALLVSVMTPSQKPVSARGARAPSGKEDTAPSAAVSAAVTNAEPSMVARNPVVSPRRPQA